MGATREDATEGGGGTVHIGKVYLAVIQAVLLFGVETWVLSATMKHSLEVVHMGFL